MVEIGHSAHVTYQVEPAHTARKVGSGDLDVLATPVVLAWCEAATCAALDLPDHQTSVGVRVAIDHVLASAIGATITARATIREADERTVVFEVTAYDEADRVVAQGEVRRAIVDRELFLSRVAPVGR